MKKFIINSIKIITICILSIFLFSIGIIIGENMDLAFQKSDLEEKHEEQLSILTEKENRIIEIDKEIATLKNTISSLESEIPKD